MTPPGQRTRLTDSGRAEVWIDDPLPGGWVCGEPVAHLPDGICGMPVESEPCPEHPPQTDAERAELLRAVVAERFGQAEGERP